jgi:hypothetical protein
MSGRPFLTRHILQRYVERFSGEKKYKHLDKCKKDCSRCKELMLDVEEHLYFKGRKVRKEIFKLIDESVELKSYRNFPHFMERIYEKYGYNGIYSVLHHKKKGILFILISSGSSYKAITCHDNKGSSLLSQLSRKTKKFGKRSDDV